MKKFVFSLQKLYEVKQSQEEHKRKKLKELLQKFDSIVGRIASLQNTYNEQKLKYTEDCVKGISAAGLQRYGDYFKFLIEETEVQKKLKADCEAEIAQCRQELLKLINEQKVLDRMRQEQYEAYTAELAKFTEKEIEDFIQGRL